MPERQGIRLNCGEHLRDAFAHKDSSIDHELRAHLLAIDVDFCRVLSVPRTIPSIW